MRRPISGLDPADFSQKDLEDLKHELETDASSLPASASFAHKVQQINGHLFSEDIQMLYMLYK